MIKVLFVCLGNICRSPLAEAIFKNKVKLNNKSETVDADSCGTASYHVGEDPDARSIELADEKEKADYRSRLKLYKQGKPYRDEVKK